jgi:hypothetical protein
LGITIDIRHAAAAAMLACLPVAAYAACPSRSETPLLPTDPARCALLAQLLRGSKTQLDEYERNLADYLSNLCHRDLAAGWKPDKRMRDTGPYVATFTGGKWTAKYYGTHMAVLVWYSPEMFAWLKKHRQHQEAPAASEPPPDGAMMIKEMFAPPATPCADVEWQHLRPKDIALMIRDGTASYDGWFWGWFDWRAARANLKAWQPDWPAAAKNPLPHMGFGQYCTNCHASAQEHTFASLRNIAGEPGEPLVFLSQDFFVEPEVPAQHEKVAMAVRRRQPQRKTTTRTSSTPTARRRTRSARFRRARGSRCPRKPMTMSGCRPAGRSRGASS